MKILISPQRASSSTDTGICKRGPAEASGMSTLQSTSGQAFGPDLTNDDDEGWEEVGGGRRFKGKFGSLGRGGG